MWNYRVMKYKTNDEFGIHEVYYDDKGNVENWTKHPIIVSDSYEQLFDVLKMIKNDIEKYGKDGILNYE